MKKIVIFAMFLVMVLLTNPASGSWISSSTFGPLSYDFDKAEWFILTPGVNFEEPGFCALSNSTWTGSVVNPTYVMATGDLTDYLKFEIYFASERETAFDMDWLLWTGDTRQYLWQSKWTGTAWISRTENTDDDRDYDRTPSVPEPAIMLLLSSGLIGLAGFRRKFKQ